MALADLRIQLEGAYEQVEATLARWESAHRALEGKRWYLDLDWVQLVAETDGETAEELALARKATAADGLEAVAILKRLRTVRRKVHAAVCRRLASLGMDASLSPESLWLAMSRELPVTYVGCFSYVTLWVLGVAVALVSSAVFIAALVHTAPAPSNYCIQPPAFDVRSIVPAILMVGVSLAILAAAWVTRVPVVLTRRRLIVASRAFPLEQIESVVAVHGMKWPSFELAVKTRDGNWFRRDTSGFPDDLFRALARLGVATRIT